MTKVNVSLQVIPCVEESKIYETVDKVIAMIEDSGVAYEVGPMETTMEGEYDELMALVKRAHEVCMESGAARVCSVIKVDYKAEGVTMNEKIGKYRA